MTRIAAGNASPNQPSIDNPAARTVAATLESTAVGGSGAANGHALPAEATPDRPAPPIGGPKGAIADAATFISDIKRWEGEERFMYVDTRGYITTGIGHLLKNGDEASKLPWYHRQTGRPATQTEIKSVFQRLSQMWTDYKTEHPNGKGYAASYYEKVSDLVLPGGEPLKLATDRLNKDFLRDLRKMFPDFDSYPFPAQRGLVDMAYNLGLGNLRHKFPNFVAACNAGDFAAAAKECHRSSSRADRNEATRSLFQSAADLTSSVRTVAKEIRL